MRKKDAAYVQPYRYPSPNIPLAAIKRFARRIAKQFHPYCQQWEIAQMTNAKTLRKKP